MPDLNSDPILGFKVLGLVWLLLCILASVLRWRRSAHLNARPTGRVLGRILAADHYRGNENDYTLVVRYGYVVDGVHYVGKLKGIPGQYYDTFEQARAALSRYPVGGEVEVFYALQKHSASRLDGDARYGDFWGYLAWYVVMFFVAGGVVTALATFASRNLL